MIPLRREQEKKGYWINRLNELGQAMIGVSLFMFSNLEQWTRRDFLLFFAMHPNARLSAVVRFEGRHHSKLQQLR